MKVLEGKVWITGQGLTNACVGINDDGYIGAVKKILKGDEHTTTSDVILPAATDMHVHFRDPGNPEKEVWATGSAAAACGGVTAVVDMPNTTPLTNSPTNFTDKNNRALSNSVVDFGLGFYAYPGISKESWFTKTYPAFWKLYPYNFSWPEYQSTVNEVISNSSRPIVIHGEHPDHISYETLSALSDHTHNRSNAEKLCLEGMPNSSSLHVAHLSTQEGLNVLPSQATSEVCPHHLLLNLSCELGIECKVDPPLRERNDNTALYNALRNGKIDILASDHAPHLMSEKVSSDPPSGIPGVETMIPLMLNEVAEDRLSLDRLVSAMAEKPAERLGIQRGKLIPGNPADIITVDLKNKTKISLENLHSKANWTPFENWDAIFPSRVFRRGQIIAKDGVLQEENGGVSIFPPTL
tara:strand:+ start:27729 stop:28958 length:1230 start_codon:yes stop_codon:yes gene_type:complete